MVGQELIYSEGVDLEETGYRKSRGVAEGIEDRSGLVLVGTGWEIDPVDAARAASCGADCSDF